MDRLYRCAPGVNVVMLGCLKVFLACFAAQCSNPPGRSRCHTICDPVSALQWTETYQSHHRRQEVSSSFCIHSLQLL